MNTEERKTIQGRVVRVDLEGGFWGVVDDAGNHYVPIEPLAAPLLKDGLRIAAEIELVTVFSSTMWGKHARFHSVSPA